METVRIFRLDHLPPLVSRRLREAQMEAARVWNLCCRTHLKARQQRTRWPNRDNLQQATKRQSALHSQTIQMICHVFLANVETTRQVKPQHPHVRYPYKEKRFYPLLWPAQAVSVEPGRVAQWEYGRDIDYLTHKCAHSRIVCFTGPERGTSSRCPECGHRQRPTGRDVVGSINMHPIAYGETIAFPKKITYLRPGPVTGSGGGMKNRPRSPEPARSSRPDTGRGEGCARRHPRCPGESAGQPPAAESPCARVLQGTGRTADIA